ncbi:carbohydrate esterase family 3 protein [Aaosphaeria arxii CBS 175.79]|uniref:Carbohydrate esterase family 3 protein n=1 Tax=Aaosphaeria arxii CBS 175.79 TaxID=1450172 RepID=A0A6A5Y4Z8_9PLEO|nr:carbohydrate esterase family 3 protein [Aaosphaeria arxii CBS 175.79]KAF2019921.1 carbohydrate esterase family 3 protein [Aaosphaeria arxii CBS 175.79]
MVKITSFAALGLLAFAGQTAAATVKVMPFGASIVTGCWRANLWRKLQNSGITNVDFVGSVKGGDCGFPFDAEHEGHSGFQATGIVANNQLPGWLSAAKPDIVMMHLGTNDIIQGKTTQQTLDAYTALVGQMRASKATMKILVAQLIPIQPGKFGDSSTRIQQLNAAIPGWAAGISTARSPVIVVDQNTGFNTSTDTTDGEHPNASGNTKIADRFYTPLASAIKTSAVIYRPR